MSSMVPPKSTMEKVGRLIIWAAVDLEKRECRKRGYGGHQPQSDPIIKDSTVGVDHFGNTCCTRVCRNKGVNYPENNFRATLSSPLGPRLYPGDQLTVFVAGSNVGTSWLRRQNIVREAILSLNVF